MMMKRMVLGVLVASALGGLPASVRAQGPTTLRIGLAEDPDTLDPTLARTFAGRFVYAALCDKLFDLDEKLSIVPQLALSHETSADGKTVTLKLRPNAKFHDGEPVDAEAVRFSLDRHLNLQGSMRRSEIAVIDTIDAVDPLTVRLTLKTPFSPLIAQLTDRAGIIVSPKAVKEAGDKFGQKPVCAGPYKFVERVAQDRIVLEKFQDYWNKDNVHIDRVVYVPVQDGAVRFVNLKAGQLDIVERLLATDAPEVRANKNLKLATAVALGWEAILFNTGKSDAGKTPLGQDARVRQAFDLAIDRDAINQVAFNGEFVAGNQWVSPDSPWYQANRPVPKRDVARAKELLREAGVTAPITVDVVVPNNPELRQVAEMLQAMAGEVGFDLKLRVMEFGTTIKEVEDGRFQAYLFIWSGRTDPDGNIYSFSRTGGVFNWGPYSNAAVDAALDEARTLTPFDQRKAAYGRAADILLKEGSFQYLYHRRVLIAHTARLEGYKQIPDGLIRVVGLRLR